MPFNLNNLVNDPAFQLGGSILGNSGVPGVVGNAFANMARINQLKQEAAAQQANIGLGQQQLAETSRYHTGELENAKATRAIAEQQFQRQSAQTDAQINLMARKQAMADALLRSFGPRLGVQIPNLPQQPSPFASPNPQGGSEMPPPMQQQGGTGVPDASGIMQNMSMQQQVPNMPNQGIHPLGNPNFNGLYKENPVDIGQPTPPTQLPSFNDSAPGPVGPPQAEPGQPPGRGAFGQPDTVTPGQHKLMKKTAGRFGTPTSVLDNLMQVESSGNPYAINKQTGAMGAYQFMPGTVNQLAQQGMAFNPFDPGQARNAADFYLAQLTRANGGNLPKALAQYGGFKQQDPTSYVQRVLSGVQMPPAMQSGMQGPPMANPGIDMAQMGALMSMAGLEGGKELVDLGGMMKPENVPAGSYQRNPMTGQTQFYGNPYEEQKIAQEAQRIGISQQELGLNAARTGMDVAKGGSQLTNEQIARNKAFTGDQDQLYKTTNWANNLKQSIDSMVQFDNKGNIVGMDPAFDQMTGATGALMRHIPGTPAYDMHEKLETLLNQTKFEVVNQMKNAAGQTGLGRVLQSEFQAMGESLAPIDPNMSTKALAQSLFKLRQEADKLTNHAQNTFSQTYGALPGDNQTNIPQATPGAVPQGAFAPVNGGQAYSPQNVPKVTKVINGVTYVKTGPSSWERQ